MAIEIYENLSFAPFQSLLRRIWPKLHATAYQPLYPTLFEYVLMVYATDLSLVSYAGEC